MTRRYPFRWIVALAAALVLAAVASPPRPAEHAAAPAPPVALSAVAVASAPPVAAASPAPALRELPVAPASQPRAARAQGSSLRAGMVVAMDPETGALGMPEHAAGEVLSVAAMQAIARQEASGLVTVRHADGSESIEHEGRFTDYTVVRIGPDGRPKFVCAHGEVGIAHALRNARATGAEDK